MKVYTSGLKAGHRLDYPKIVNDLLRLIPPEHLAGIAYVTVSGDRPLDDDDEVMGHYFERCEGEPAGVILYLEVMKKEVPAPFRLLAVTWKVLIAQTLFHEVGHHYQRFSHGIGKNRQEDHAESYGDAYSRKAFPRLYPWIDLFRRFRRRCDRAMITLWTLLVRILPRPGWHYRVAQRYSWEGEWAKVVTHLEKALELDPRFERARRALPQARSMWSRAERRASAALAYRARAAARRRSPGRRGRRNKNGRRR